MHLRGLVVDVGEERVVDTGNGPSSLREVHLQPTDGAGEAVTVTLWNKWAETGAVLEPGMELAAYDLAEREYQGETQYTTAGDAMIVVEPDFLVDVTDVRAWVQCPRMYYLNKIGGTPLAEPVVKGTLVHEVFGDLLRGRDLETAVEDRITEAGLELGLLGIGRDAITADVRQHASAIAGWLSQGSLVADGPEAAGEGAGTPSGSEAAPGSDPATGSDSSVGPESTTGSARAFGPSASEWRSELTLVSERYGIKGRADAVRRGMPVELKTGKNTRREPRFQDKVQAACYALVLGERRGEAPDTGTLLYTKNAAVERTEESGDLSPAKDFAIGPGLLAFVLRARNEIAAMEFDASVPTGHEADATCEYCFEQDTCMAVAGRLDQESKAGQVGSPIPAEERDYFDRFYRAIEAERREVHREYAKLWEQSPDERADADRALVDLEPTGTRRLDDGSWELRARGTGAVSKIREGDLVLASDGEPIAGEAEMARVERLGGLEASTGSPEGGTDATGTHGAVIVVTADEPLDLRRLDVYPSELFTDRQLTALHDAVLTQSPAAKDVLFERREPEFQAVEQTFVENNAAQDAAVTLAVGAEDCALVHGPPGTGKTYTLARTVRALVDRGNRVLLAAFTNRAVDNAVEALAAQGYTDVVRMGTESGVRDDLQAYRLETAGEPEERAAALLEADVVAATTATCGSRVMREQDFDVAVVDEAGQLTEPGTLAATALADRFVLVGDHEQLPPVVQAETGDREGLADLGRSLFARLIEDYPDASVMLDRQYRMAQRIQAFPSEAFYDGALRPATAEVAGQTVGDLEAVEASALGTLADRVTFLDPEGAAEGNTNPAEAAGVVDVVRRYVDAGVDPADVGVIAPFRAQVAEIGKRLTAGLEGGVGDAVAVDTVDRFQGSSKEVIVVSFTATGSLDGPIFEDHRRMNVALTRAKKALVVVGDEATLRSEPLYERLVEWAT
ncbi:MAG: AAA domain-containing protein [Haloarculaceae archaeon]